MATFLQRLGETHKAEDRFRARVERERQWGAIFEDAWACSDPFQTGRNSVGLGSAPNDLLQYAGASTHTARLGSRRDGDFPPFYRTSQDHEAIVDTARILEGLCPTAVNVLDTLSQFAVFTGFDYTIVPREQGANRDLVKKSQRVLDDWQKQVDWYSWELELFRRGRRDGESFCILEPDPSSGLLNLRAVEPEQVREPHNTAHLTRELGLRSDTSWKYGILTSKENTAVPAGYWVVSQHNEQHNLGQFFAADEVFHLKTEWVDRQAKRGVSDFFSVANDIPGTRKLLRNLREGATVQATIAWIREHPEGSTPNAMGATEPITTRSGQPATAVHLDGPTMLDVPFGLKYTAGPMSASGKADVLVKVLQAALRNVGIRWQFPEGMISGDLSNSNLASALVAEGPFVRSIQARQWHYRNAYRGIVMHVIDHAAIRGLIGPARENIWDDIKLSVKMPPVAARKLREETDRNSTLHERGILSTQAWSAREDLDFAEEQAKLAESPVEVPAAGGSSRIQAEPEGERVT